MILYLRLLLHSDSSRSQVTTALSSVRAGPFHGSRNGQPLFYSKRHLLFAVNLGQKLTGVYPVCTENRNETRERQYFSRVFTELYHGLEIYPCFSYGNTRSFPEENSGMDSISASNTITGMKIRRIEPEDASNVARSCYDSFLAFNESVGIPPRLDFVSLESAVGLMKDLSSKPEIFGVVAVEGVSGSIMAGGFLFPGDMYEIGLIFADNAFKGRGGAKAVVVALLEKAKSDHAKSIRLNQITANVGSFAMYASLGFLPVDCWTAFEGCVTNEQAASASHSIGYQPPTGVHVRRMEDADVKSCNDLHIKINGLGRPTEIRELLSGSWVATQDGQILAYTTGFNLTGHAVAATEEALVLLFTEVCLRRPATDPLPTLHVLGRLYPRLLQWALAAKLKVRRNCWLMVIGFYQSPQHGMVYSPSINA